MSEPMNFIDTIAWAVVELNSPKPKLDDIKKALEQALQDAARLELEKDSLHNSLIRVAQVTGVDGALTASTRLGGIK